MLTSTPCTGGTRASAVASRTPPVRLGADGGSGIRRGARRGATSPPPPKPGSGRPAGMSGAWQKCELWFSAKPPVERRATLNGGAKYRWNERAGFNPCVSKFALPQGQTPSRYMTACMPYQLQLWMGYHKTELTWISCYIPAESSTTISGRINPLQVCDKSDCNLQCTQTDPQLKIVELPCRRWCSMSRRGRRSPPASPSLDTCERWM